jgi:hypothetical protein
VIIATGQEFRQEWQIRQTAASDMVNFRVERWKAGGHSSTAAMFRSRDSTAFRRMFSIAADRPSSKMSWMPAGSSARAGLRGSGTFQFRAQSTIHRPTPSPWLQCAEWRALVRHDDADVSLQFARGLRDAGLHPTTGQLIDMRIHGVDSE